MEHGSELGKEIIFPPCGSSFLILQTQIAVVRRAAESQDSHDVSGLDSQDLGLAGALHIRVLGSNFPPASPHARRRPPHRARVGYANWSRSNWNGL